MRLAFFLLVLGNLAFYVWSAGYLGKHEDGREPERLQQQVAPEKIEIVSGSRSKPGPDTAGKAEVGCRLVSGLASEEAITAVEKQLAAEAGLTVTRQTAAPQVMHWVLIPGMASRALAEKKVTELKQLGVTDTRIVSDEAAGPYIVSLGIFGSEKAARDHLAAVGKKGVRLGRYEARERSNASGTLAVTGTALGERLPKLLASHPEAALGDCPSQQ